MLPYFKDVKRMPARTRLRMHNEKSRRLAELEQEKPQGWPDDRNWSREAARIAEQEVRAQFDSVALGKIHLETYVMCPCCGGRIAIELVAGQVAATPD